jgi:hypothetical protein
MFNEIRPTAAARQRTNNLINMLINPNRRFELYSITTGDALSKPANFNTTCDELERLEDTGNAGSAVDIREVK